VRQLHLIAGGRRDLRMPVRGDGLAADLGQGINELLGAVVPDEGLSSSTPGIRRVVRPGEATDPKLRARILGPVGRAPEAASAHPDLDEGVGPVRVRPRDSQAVIAHYDTEVSGPPELDARIEPHLDAPEIDAPPAVATSAGPEPEAAAAADAVAPTSATDEAVAEPALPASPGEPDAAPRAAGPTDDDEVLPAEPVIDPGVGGNGSSVSFASAVSLVEAPPIAGDVPDSRRSLFDVYLSAKKRLGEDVEAVSYEVFDHELGALESQLKQERGCDDVRFDVRVVDGRVALQPRLVRHKALVS
jgi:hypothetical protein